MSENLLIWPRAAGIGDTFSVLAEGLTVFKGEEFSLIIGRESQWEASMMVEYRNHYFEICRNFDLCKSVEIKELENDDEALSLEKEKKEEGNKVHIVDYMGLKNAIENIHFIREKFYYHYTPEVDLSTRSLIEKGKTNICIHLKHAKRGNENDQWVSDWHLLRSVKLDKWKAFIKELAEDSSNNIICIGVKEQYHPFHLWVEDIKDTLKLSNVKCQLSDEESITKDTYLIKYSDLFIGSSSGPTHIAWLLAKPSIVFDYKRLKKALKIFLFELMEDQKICWGDQTVEEMVHYSKGYIESSAPLVKKSSIKERILKQEQKLIGVLAEFSLEQRDRLKKYSTFQEIYFRIFELYLQEGRVGKAFEYEDIAKGFIDFNDKYQFFRIGRLFKDLGEYQKAADYFKEAINWCDGTTDSDIAGASYYHLGDICLKSHDMVLAVDYFINCIFHLPEHKKAREILYKLLENEDKSYVVWSESDVKTPECSKTINNKGFITNDTRKWKKSFYENRYYEPSKLLGLKPDLIFIKKTEADFLCKQLQLMNLNFNYRVVLLND